MATIDRAQLLTDTKFWLPSSNALDDTGLGIIHEMVIAQVGDDDSHYAEVLCKSLKAAAQKNLADSSANSSGSGGLKREKLGKFEKEYYQETSETGQTGWQDYIDGLSSLCPLFGYSPKRATGIKINTGGTFDPLCESVGDSVKFT